LVAVVSHTCQYLLLRCGHLCGCREGRAGGYKEFDEAEIEETKRRRKELEEVGGLSYQIDATIFNINSGLWIVMRIVLVDLNSASACLVIVYGY
jgi:hypothetical protein